MPINKVKFFDLYKQMSLSKLAINFHFTRVCNFNCVFCFHTKKTNFMLSLPEQIEIIKLAREEGAEKINFAGGEPFLFPERLGEMVKVSKDLGYSSVSIISNSSVVRPKWFDKYGKYIDIMGISCDSIDPVVNFKHGRNFMGCKKPISLKNKILQLSKICHDMNILFKVNTVVTQVNKNEILSPFINELNPARWKIFQLLEIKNENQGKTKNLQITKQEFQNYCERNKKYLNNKNIMVPEINEKMQNSYIIIDEFGCFLDVSSGSKVQTQSILKVGIKKAFEELGKGFDKEMFYKRGGYYQWQKPVKH